MIAGLALLLAMGTAVAAETEDPDATRWVRIDPNGECQPNQPDRSRIELVRDTFNKREDLAEVEEDLRRRALDAMRSSVCAGRSPSECAAVEQRIAVDVRVDFERRLICAASLLSSQIAEDPKGLFKDDAHVAALAAQLLPSLGDKPVGRIAVTWASGCGAGAAGNRLREALQQQLLDHGLTVTRDRGQRLVAELAPGPDIKVTVWRHDPAGSATAIGSTTLSLDWFPLYGAVGDRCRGDRDLGLVRSERPGADGLQSSVTVDPDGPLCSGDAATIRIEPSALARIQVWSVSDSGEAWMSWASDGAIDRRVTLDVEAMYVPGFGEETLLVLTAPDGVSLPPGQQGCRRAGLTSQDLPKAAGLAATRFQVMAPGSEGCTADVTIQTSLADYQAAPPCH